MMKIWLCNWFMKHQFNPAVLWLGRVYYCHHNARVIEDFEDRMSFIAYQNTRGMSKPYYDKHAMQSEIEAYYEEIREEALQDDLEPIAIALGLPPDTWTGTILKAAQDRIEATNMIELRADNEK